MLDIQLIVEVIWGGSLVIAIMTVFLIAVCPELRLAIVGPRTDREFDDLE